MNSLPLISHHLFVAAVASEERAPRPADNAANAPSPERREQELEQESNPDAWYAAASAARRARPHSLPRGS